MAVSRIMSSFSCSIALSANFLTEYLLLVSSEKFIVYLHVVNMVIIAYYGENCNGAAKVANLLKYFASFFLTHCISCDFARHMLMREGVAEGKIEGTNEKAVEVVNKL